MTRTGHLFDANGRDTHLDLTAVTASAIGADQLLWLDVGRNEEDLRATGEALEMGAALVGLSQSRRRPEVLRSEGAVRVRAIGLARAGNGFTAVPIDFFARPNLVVSIHDEDVLGLDAPIRENEGDTRLGKLDAGTFLALLLDGMLGGYFEAVEEIEKTIDELDEKALGASDADELLNALVALRRRIAQLRRALAPQREVFASLNRPDAELEAEILGAAWPGLAQRFQLAVDTVENARELLIGCFDIVMTRTSQRTNDVMRVLTVVSAVLLPSVVVAGVMGMNFKVGLFDESTNFFLVLGMMLGLAAVILLVARLRRWV
jgi:magnesium transporter